MRKKLRFKLLILFFLFTFLIISCMAFYQYKSFGNNLEKLTYLNHPEWSLPVKLIQDINTFSYEIISEEQGFLVFWLKRIEGIETLFMQKFDYQGRNLSVPFKIKESEALRDFSVLKAKDGYHLFWLEGPEERNISLEYCLINDQGELIERERILNNLCYATNIKAFLQGNKAFLTWQTTRNEHDQIEMGFYSFKDKKFFHKSITSNNLLSIFPNIFVSSNSVHLIWLEQNPDLLYETGGKVNSYLLKYRSFDLDLNPVTSEITVGPATTYKYFDEPGLLCFQDRVYAVWSKFADERNPSLEFCCAFWPENLKKQKGEELPEIKTIKLSSGFGDFIMSDLTAKGGNLILGYAHLIKNKQFIKCSVIRNSEICQVPVTRRFFKGQDLGYHPELFLDNEQNLCLTWVEYEKEGNILLYASRANPYRPGFFEVVGIKLGIRDLSFLTTCLYFLSTPILKSFQIFFIAMCALVITEILFRVPGKKLNYLASNKYFAYFLVVIVVLLIILVRKSISFLFYPGPPVEGAFPVLFGLSMVFGLVFTGQVKSTSGNGNFAGIACGVLFIYWMIVGNLVFYSHLYTF